MTNLTSYRCYKPGHFLFEIGVFCLLLFAACNNQERSDHKVAAISNEKGDSMPGMDMANHNDHQPATKAQASVKKEADDTDSSLDETYWNALPTNQTVIAKQQAVQPSFSDTMFSIQANGYITFDTRRNHKIPIRVGGRIERLFVKYNYQYVRKGEKILELYSPELNTYVEEYLYVRRSTTDSLLQRRAKEKLLLLGLTASQVKQIDKTGFGSFTVPIYSPFEGYVLFNPSISLPSMENGASSSGGMIGMNPAPNPAAVSQASGLSDNSIREGMYVSKDQTLFWINDFREVWGILAFNKQNEKYVNKGQMAIVQSELFPDESFRSVIQFTEPVYQQGQKFTQARIYISNDKRRLKQNSLIKGTIFLPAKTMLLPASSVIYLGRVAIVWVQTGTTGQGSHIFQSRIVSVGRRSSDKVEILEGLQPNEWVAKDAAYLADSETIIHY